MTVKVYLNFYSTNHVGHIIISFKLHLPEFIVGQVRMAETDVPQAEASPATGNHVSQYYLYMVEWSATKLASPLGR